MALAHAAAAGLVGLWLAAGERALWSLARHAGRVLRRPADRRSPGSRGGRASYPSVGRATGHGRRSRSSTSRGGAADGVLGRSPARHL